MSVCPCGAVDDRWCEFYTHPGCPVCHTHHRHHPDTCAGITEDGQLADGQFEGVPDDC